MKTAPVIFEAWDQGGPFIGDRKAHSRVTVEEDWELHMTGRNWGASSRGPFRWFQRANLANQLETEVPNVKNIDIDRSIDNDAATATIVLYNQWMNLNGVAGFAGQLGNPGYFTFSHGQSPESQARWSQEANDWEDVLVPNALLRTYQGYGGNATPEDQLTIPDALDEGFLTLSGVWLIDDVTIRTDGMLEVKCRDMAKMLIEQQLYPPLIPRAEYPLKFCRYTYENRTIKNREIFRTETADRRTTYGDCEGTNSGSDVWYGPNASVHGHRPSHAFDGNAGTFWLSVGNSDHRAPYAVEWIEQCCHGQEISEVYIHPWAGNYQCFISVMERGRWVRGPTIAYDSAGVGLYDGVNTAEIPYVHQFGVPWETGKWYKLPRTYKADKIRVTLTNLTLSAWGPYRYRAGIRELRARYNVKVNVTPLVSGSAPFPTEQNPNGAGYWMLRNNGRVFGFGDARRHKLSASNPGAPDPSYGGAASNVNAIAINATPSGRGYWVMHSNGRMIAYGDAEHYGDWRTMGIRSNTAQDFAPTPSGLGYWILGQDGNVYAFGDAVDHGGLTVTGQNYAQSIESHPANGGYWILKEEGQVSAFGGAAIFTVHGHANVAPWGVSLVEHEYFTRIRRTSTGNGYWVVSGSGKVRAFGDATFFGEDPKVDLKRWAANLYWDMIPYWQSDQGYGLPSSFDVFLFFGPDWQHFGSVQEGNQILRRDGNYKDYADIIKLLLLWSGWLLYQDPDVPEDDFDPGAEPPVYGNIETTGAFSPECLPTDMFDKHPVIDAINQIKEIVGFLFFIGDEGEAHFETPNWWAPGNFNELGEPLDEIPVIDERVQMTEYAANANARSARSEIIITTEDPEGLPDEVQGNSRPVQTVRFVPHTAGILRGMCQPAMWVNGVFQDPDEARIMAELIAMHIWFSQRTGSLSCAANPAIQINDQIRIYERQTAETYVHYVRGIRTHHDLDKGSFKMDLDTHWLGDQEDWSVVSLGTVLQQDAGPIITPTHGERRDRRIVISNRLRTMLERIDSPKIDNAVLTNFGAPVEDTMKARV